jgi:hypothetical protein
LEQNFLPAPTQVAPVGGLAAGGVARSALGPRALVLLAAPNKAKAAADGGFGKVAAGPSEIVLLAQPLRAAIVI